MRPAAVIVLAAGEGTRMKSRLNKNLHEIGGRSLVGHVTGAGRAVEPEHVVVVLGNGSQQVIDHLAKTEPGVETVVQEDRAVVGRYGTGYATRLALEYLPPLEGTVIVTTGDTPLLTGETLRRLAASHEEGGAKATVLTALVPDPTGYGRIIRGADDSVQAIVEHKEATPTQLEIREINSGIIAFDASALVDALTRVKTDNSQGEEYLTDVLGILRGEGLSVGAMVTEDDAEILGVNNRVQLAELGRILNDRILRRWMLEGVTVVDPATTWVQDTVALNRDVTLHPNTQLEGSTVVGEGASIGPDTTLIDCEVGADATVVRVHGLGATIGARATVGPYAYLRPGTKLGDKGKIGTFVETKNAEIGEGTKVPHLSYVGDATIGRDTNLGAGTIVANYDGINKHHTDIGDAVFIGSNSVLVAPRSIADGVYVAAGSGVVKDIAPGELAVARAQQRNIDGWVERKRAGTKTDAAARRAKQAAGDTGAAGGASGEPIGDNGTKETST